MMRLNDTSYYQRWHIKSQLRYLVAVSTIQYTIESGLLTTSLVVPLEESNPFLYSPKAFYLKLPKRTLRVPQSPKAPG